MNSDHVSDLNFSLRVCPPSGDYYAGGKHEDWYDLVCPDHRVPAVEDLASDCGALHGRLLRPHPDVRRAVPLHGVRSARLPGEPSRHRSLPVGPNLQGLSQGFRSPVSHSTLADANKGRGCRIYADEVFGMELSYTVYALDATTIDLCLSMFPRALVSPFLGSEVRE